MLVSSDFIGQLIEKHRMDNSVMVHITDENAKILISTVERRIGTASVSAQQTLALQRTMILDSERSMSNLNMQGGVKYCTPYYVHAKISGAVIVAGSGEVVATIGGGIRTAMETALEYDRFYQLALHNRNPKTALGYDLLSPLPDKQSVMAQMNQMELDSALLRTVIYIKLIYHQNKYFNINLNLGYQSSIERIKYDALSLVEQCPYLNGQDICFVHDIDSIVIIKSFIPTQDIHRVYLALDVICKNMADTLKSLQSLSFHIAYGNVYSSIAKVSSSYEEALDIIALGLKSGSEDSFYTINSFLFDSICQSLHPQIINKMMKPLLDKLRKKDGSLHMDIVNCAEVFVDCCMNFSLAAQTGSVHRNTISARLEKLRELTDLDPISKFNDALLIKLLAVYIRGLANGEGRV